MISGISQLTIGPFLFGISIFASGIITARILFVLMFKVLKDRYE